MADIFVGSVSVGVVPDARGWNTKLRAELVPASSAVGDEVGQTMGRKITDSMGKAGSDSAGAFDATFRKRLKAALDALPKAKIDGDSTDVDRKVQELRAKLEELSRMDVINADHAMEQLAIVDRELGRISSKAKDIPLRFNTTEARAQLALLSKEASGTGPSPAKGILGGLSASPGIVGPALALAPAAGILSGVAAGVTAGVGGALAAGMLSLIGFGAVAKPILAQAETATKAVETAQQNYNVAIATGTKHAVAYKAEQIAINKAYADMSPAQIALSKQLGVMSKAWDAVKAAQAPVVAAAVTPWLKAITDGMKLLGPIIQHVAPVIAYLGTQFDNLVNSGSFKAFRDWIASTGTAVVSAAGSFLIDFLKALVIILPQFDPLIREAAGYLGNLGPALVRWASSKSTADHIQGFMQWFSTNGKVVGDFLKNIGGALKAMIPGLTAGGVTELSMISAFLGMVAKLPPSIAKPLFEIAGALLILNKLGVVKVGIQLLGMDAAKAAAAGGAVGLWGKLLPGVRFVGGALLAEVAVVMTLKSIPNQGDTGVKGQKGNWWETPFNMPGPKSPKSSGNWLTSWAPWERFLTVTVPGWFTSMGHGAVIAWNIMWDEVVGRGSRGVSRVASVFDSFRHEAAVIFDGIRHDTDHVWDIIWNDTIAKVIQGAHDLEAWYNRISNWITGWWSNLRYGSAQAWDAVWNNTIGRAIRGAQDLLRIFGQLKQNIINWFHDAVNWLSSAGSSVISGLYNGIRSAIAGVGGWIKGNVVDPIIGAVKHFFGISSPSAVMMPLGASLIQGLIKGMLTSGADLGHLVGTIFGSWPQALASLAEKSLVDVAKLPEKALKALGGLGSKLGGFFAKLFGGGGSGVQRWAGTVAQALSMMGLPLSLAPQVLRQISSESGGNPNAINLTDINAQMGDPSRGLLQTIGSTFAAYHVAGTSENIYDPLANIAAAINYAAHVYGPSLMSGGMGLGSGHGYDIGGWLPPGATMAYNGTGSSERILSHSEYKALAASGPTYVANFDSLTGQAIEGHVRSAFQAMSLTSGNLNRQGRRM